MCFDLIGQDSLQKNLKLMLPYGNAGIERVKMNNRRGDSGDDNDRNQDDLKSTIFVDVRKKLV